jgi:dienelactone hydrolase
MIRSRKVAAWFLGPILLFGAALYTTRQQLRGASFVIQAANMEGAARTVAEWGTEQVSESPASVPWRGGNLAARWYVPADPSGRPILLVPGVHAAGIDEPRLVGFARDVASMGHTVLTAELPTSRINITARATDMIEDAALWLAGQREHPSDDGRVGMMGISFAGGLSIVAAARPALKDRVAFVMSFGGHGDLPRTLRYLCTGIQPTGEQRPPHDYGVAIILLGVAERVVPADEAVPLQQAILAFLEASRLDMVDKPRAKLAFDHARELAQSLDEPARTLMGYVNERSVAKLGPVLLPHLSALSGDDAVPGASGGAIRHRLPAPRDGGQRYSCCGVIAAGRDVARQRGARPPARDAVNHPRRGRSERGVARVLGSDPVLGESAG